MQVKLVSRPPRMVPPTVRERSEPLGVTTAAKLRSLRELCQIRAEPRLVSDQNLCGQIQNQCKSYYYHDFIQKKHFPAIQAVKAGGA